MIEGIIIFILIILLGTSGYVIWNLNRKLEHIESWVESFVLRVRDTYNNMTVVDSKGHFEADDEVGSIFQGIKSIITELNESIEEEI
tara:strand:- start:4 stop:264 length:261 start_codon:yes stop_codon:yes gene_type:complete